MPMMRQHTNRVSRASRNGDQLIINKELSLQKMQNPSSAFIIEELTDLVEAAVLLNLTEHERGVLCYGNDVPTF
jgi:methylmalonyl-CoA mutase N-terminal domain/subunit